VIFKALLALLIAFVSSGLVFFALKSGQLRSRSGGVVATRQNNPVIFWFVTGMWITATVLMLLVAVDLL
jgi:hypothetical protein